MQAPRSTGGGKERASERKREKEEKRFPKLMEVSQDPSLPYASYSCKFTQLLL